MLLKAGIPEIISHIMIPKEYISAAFVYELPHKTSGAI